MLITNIICIGLGASIGAIGGVLWNSLRKTPKEKPTLETVEVMTFNKDNIIKNNEEDDKIEIEEI